MHLLVFANNARVRIVTSTAFTSTKHTLLRARLLDLSTEQDSLRLLLLLSFLL